MNENSFKILEQKLLESLGLAGVDNVKMTARYPSTFVDVTINGAMSPSTVLFLIEHAVELQEFYPEAQLGVKMIDYGIVINNLAFSIQKWRTPEAKEQILRMCRQKKTLVRLTFCVSLDYQWR